MWLLHAIRSFTGSYFVICTKIINFADTKRRYMDKGILNIETIAEYNRMMGIETINPLVSVIDLSNANPIRHMRHTLGFYTIFLKDTKCGDLIYGRQRYDYQEGTVVCIAPGQVIGIEDNGETFQPQGYALCFDPELIRGTSLGRHIRNYTYFSYEVNEALHVSESERAVIVDCLDKIRQETEHPTDRLSRRLTVNAIEFLLNYCLRFYECQFTNREQVNNDILARFETLLDDYLTSDKPELKGLPSVKYCAGELCLSPNYFGDLIKKLTGKSAQEYIQLKIMDVAKERILIPSKSISQISYELGFQYPQHFTRMFKKVVGLTPNKYRTQGIEEL